MFKKFIAAALILSQSSIAFADAGTATTAAHTPEYLMFHRALALQGQDFSDAEVQSRLNDSVLEYAKTADPQGQEQRIKQAFVDLGVYTPEQADAFVTDANTWAPKIASATSTEEQMQIKAAAVKQLALAHPMAGAQFSGCGDLVRAIGFVGVGFGLAAVVRQSDPIGFTGFGLVGLAMLIAVVGKC